MKIDKSLEDVWKWKNEIYEETKHMTMRERVKHICKDADELCEQRNIHLEIYKKN